MKTDRHMVSAGHHLAADAAREILDAGGNAADAGVCGGICLAVLFSEYVNFAGVAPIIYRHHETGEVTTISGLGWWPQKASLEVIQRNYGGKIPLGILRTVIPGAPDAWISALDRFGTMSFGEVAHAAIQFARNGFAVTQLSAEIFAAEIDELRRWPENERIYLPGGRPPRAGEILVLEDLAGSLQYMADQEKSATKKGRAAGLQAARSAFYQGDIARKITRYHAENNGWLTADDLANFRVEIEPASRSNFCGLDIYTCGPWCQGPLLSQVLNILAARKIEYIASDTSSYIHTVVEAMKLGFADRHAYYGDPRFIDVPLQTLLSPAYARHRATRINPDKACPGMPAAGEIAGYDPGTKKSPPAAVDRYRPPERDTSFICTVDKQGNCFAATPSDVNSTAPVIPGTGLIPSPRGSQSFEDPSHPACLAPGKRPRLTPNPAIVINPGQWAMPFGTPGNDVQVQAMVEVLLNIHLHKMSVQRAINAPRFATMSFPQTSTPHQYDKDLLLLEGRIPDAIGNRLTNLGHTVKKWRDFDWRAGAVCAIRRYEKTGRLEGGADPRRPSGVA
ncbi:MAG: gamma-glutamyltransferase [Desulfobacteraceae bacterium]|nr:gamma-glutamyltransferase [Desulfobacteraceae bacterium]